MSPRLRINSLCVALTATALTFVCGDSAEEVPFPTATPSPLPGTPEPPPLLENHRIIIDKIGVDAPVSTYGLDENAIPVVPTGRDAAEVVAWYKFSAPPGMRGNAVYAGHVTWNGNGVFMNLALVAPGDFIRLRDERGAEVAYRVTEVFSVHPGDPKSVDVIPAIPRNVSTVVTCGGTYFENNDPILGGDYTQRRIVRGELASVTRVD